MVAKTGKLIRIGLLGYGYWGPNLARNVQASRSCELASIGDPSPARLAQARLKHRGIRLTDRWSDVVADRSIDAVAIATPVDSHFELAWAALAAGKHVFLEKPMTHSSVEALWLMEESERRRLVLMVDHTFLFEPAVPAIARVLGGGELGRLALWQSERTNRGVVRRDVNVLWDLAAHDLSILDYVLAASPSAISTAGASLGAPPGDGGLERAACLTLHFPGCLTARIHVSWDGPRKVRRIAIRGEAGVLVYDDLDPIRKVTVVSSADPKLARVLATEAAEPLAKAIEHFARCVAAGGRPIAGAVEGLRVVRLLEAADRSLQSLGQMVVLNQVGVGA